VLKLSKKFGLGKGLGALLPDEEVVEEGSITKIDINRIKANENQPRKYFDEEKIAQLSQSIKEHGIIQPVVLKKEDDAFVIVAGERRWRAAKYIGLKEIPAVVMDINDKQLLEISLIENLQREDLNPIEEALAYKRLIDEFSMTQEELGVKVGKSRTAVTNSMRLLNLDKRVQNYLIDGVISEGHGRALLGIEDRDIQYSLAQKIIDEGLNVRQTEEIIRNSSKEANHKKEKESSNKTNPYLNDVKSKLEGYFGTKVQLTSKDNNKGKIEIEYYSDEDLNRILEILNI
jgi:ParB family transcriptional regulator, chromosome partitioning protein